MAVRDIYREGISFDTTGDENVLLGRLFDNTIRITHLQDKELLEKQKEFFEKICEIALAMCGGNCELMERKTQRYELIRTLGIPIVHDHPPETPQEVRREIGRIYYDALTYSAEDLCENLKEEDVCDALKKSIERLVEHPVYQQEQEQRQEQFRQDWDRKLKELEMRQLQLPKQ